MKNKPVYKKEHIGTYEIKGGAYEDFMGILWTNGYESAIITPSKEVTGDKSFNEITRTISVYKVTEE